MGKAMEPIATPTPMVLHLAPLSTDFLETLEGPIHLL